MLSKSRRYSSLITGLAYVVISAQLASAQTATGADSVPSNAPTNPLPISSAGWTAAESGGNFADVGSGLGRQRIALLLPAHSSHFEVILTGFTAPLPDGAVVNFNVVVDGSAPIQLSGTNTNGVVIANLDDATVAAWTHIMTAGQMMEVLFTNTNEGAWAIPLAGTTPTVTAMAAGIKLAGITGLPAPWSLVSSSDNTNAETSSLAPTSTPGATDQNRNSSPAQAPQADQEDPLLAGLPACGDPENVQVLKDAVANSPAGKVKGIELLDIGHAIDVTKKTQIVLGGLFGISEPGYRLCSVDAVFNDGEHDLNFSFHRLDKQGGSLIVELSYVDPP